MTHIVSKFSERKPSSLADALAASGIKLPDTRPGTHRAACPQCARSSRDDALAVTVDDGGAVWFCHRCAWTGAWRPSGECIERIPKAKHASPLPANDDQAERREKALYLWRRSVEPAGTQTETYLRYRGYGGAVPPTIRHLPTSEKYPCTMVAAFAIPSEPEPGMLHVADDAVVGVHLTRLAPDGFGKAVMGPAKIMLGRSIGTPIVLTPMNDSLGLAITEGIESGLSIYEATGLGVWTAGAAGRMAALMEAVPGYTDCVTIAAESDAAGLEGASKLAEGLRARGIYVEIRTLGGAA